MKKGNDRAGGADDTAEGQGSTQRAARKAQGMPDGGEQPRYENWTLEELRALGVQLQISGAEKKNRDELIEILGANR